MAKQKNNLQELSISDLQSMVNNSQAQLQQMRISHGLSLLDQPSSMKVERRNLARILTELTARKKSTQ